MVYVEIVVAVVVILTTLLPAYGKVRRNRVLGVRSRATLASDESWRRGHRAALLPTILTGGVAMAGGIVAVSLGHVNEPFPVVILAIILMGGAVWSLIAADRAASA